MAVKKRELTKNIRALNKLKLAGAIDTKGDVEDLQEDFISTIEEIDDDGKIQKVPDAILDFYESLIPDDGDEDDGDDKGGDDDLEDELNEMSLKELRAYMKENKVDFDGRVSTKNKDDAIEACLDAAEGGGDDDEDDKGGDEDLENELNEMTIKELRAYVKDNKVPWDGGRITGKNKEDVIDVCLDAAEDGGDDNGDDDAPDFDGMDQDDLLDFCDENDIELTERQEGLSATRLRKIVVKKYEAAAKKSGGGKSTGKSSKSSGIDLPKGMRANTLNAAMYELIADGGATMADIAEVVAEKKGKEPKQVYGLVYRTLVRKVAKCAEIKATFTESGNDADIIFETV